MTKSPIFWGLGLTCALGGVLAGNAVGSYPVTDRAAVVTYYQEHKTATVGQYGDRLLPDHYPLVTRDGVVEVTELSDRGLFRQARYRPSNVAAGYATTANGGDPGVGFEDEYAAGSQQDPVGEAIDDSAAAVPLAQANSQAVGQAKIIDMQATLAMR